MSDYDEIHTILREKLTHASMAKMDELYSLLNEECCVGHDAFTLACLHILGGLRDESPAALAARSGCSLDAAIWLGATVVSAAVSITLPIGDDEVEGPA